MEKPQILVLSGIPTSGKSTFRNNPIYKDWVIVCRDDIRDRFWGKDYKYSDENEKRVSIICENTFNGAIRENKNIIIDATHCKEVYLKLWIEVKPSNYDLKVYFFEIDLWEAYIRNIWRWITTRKYIPIKVIKNMKKNFDKIDKNRYDMVF